jgi:hypothetical protein
MQPAGVIGGSTFTFTWQAADGATFYYLQVNDATASPRLMLWCPAAMACSGGSATCSATLTVGWAAGPARAPPSPLRFPGAPEPSP